MRLAISKIPPRKMRCTAAGMASVSVVEGFWPLWSTVVETLRKQGVAVGPFSFHGWNDGDAGFVRAISAKGRAARTRTADGRPDSACGMGGRGRLRPRPGQTRAVPYPTAQTALERQRRKKVRRGYA
jgi:hypothetical protein